jgi:hypothetical protein
LVAKALVKELEANGRSSLVDKVILVAVPEEGSIEAVAGLLHGDDEELGRGFLMRADVARTLGINMPSSYYLLPSQALLSQLSAPAIKFNEDISNISALDTFLKNSSGQRLYSKTASDTKLPARLNPLLLDAARTRRAASSVPTSGIKFINILGTGIKTVSGIRYENTDCSNPNGNLARIGIITCGLSHYPVYTDSGDGMVLTGNMNERWGDKLIFDMGAYNAHEGANHSHTDMISSKPVLDVIHAILDDGPYPPITAWSDYVRPVAASSESSVPLNPIKRGYEIRTTGNVLLSVTDGDRITGLKAESLEANAFPVIAKIPNSSFSARGGNMYVLTESLPQSISAESAGETGNFSVQMARIDPMDEVGNTATSSMIFYFNDVPMAGETKINISSLDGDEPVMHIDRDGDGLYESEKIFSENDVAWLESYVYGSGQAGQGTGTSSPHSLPSTITSKDALSKLRSDISSSSISLRFRQRYTTRTNPVAAYINKNQDPAALAYAARTTDSLAAIVKELSRPKDRYYKGGMTKAEASFMYFSWADFTSAMRGIISLNAP